MVPGGVLVSTWPKGALPGPHGHHSKLSHPNSAEPLAMLTISLLMIIKKDLLSREVFCLCR